MMGIVYGEQSRRGTHPSTFHIWDFTLDPEGQAVQMGAVWLMANVNEELM